MNSSGHWGDQQIGTCSANLYKVTSSKTLTLTLQPIGKTATFDIIDNSKRQNIGEKAFLSHLRSPLSVLYVADINGVFHFSLLDDLKDTSVANYTSDRLLFYPSQNKDKLVGVVCFFFLLDFLHFLV